MTIADTAERTPRSHSGRARSQHGVRVSTNIMPAAGWSVPQWFLTASDPTGAIRNRDVSRTAGLRDVYCRMSARVGTATRITLALRSGMVCQR